MSETFIPRELPVGAIGRLANGWWGMITLIVTEGALFAYLLFSYFYTAVQNDRSWLPAELPSFAFAGPNTLILLLSSAAAWQGEKVLHVAGAEGKNTVAAWIAAAALLGAIFVAVQWWEWSTRSFTLSTSSYGSLFYTITGFDMIHIAVSVLILLALTLWTLLGYFDGTRSAAVSIGVLYWYFVTAVWLAVFVTFYIAPRLDIG